MTISKEELLGMTRRELKKVLADGHPIDSHDLDDREYHGISLGLPRWAEKLSWKKFKKVFRREKTGGLRGWNVAVIDNSLAEDWIDAKRNNLPVTYWHYVVVQASGHPLPGPYEKGLLIHYGWGGNSRLSTMRPIRDPLLAVNAGSNELLLGYSYLDFGFVRLDTPTFFCLSRGGHLNYEVPSPHPQRFPGL